MANHYKMQDNSQILEFVLKHVMHVYFVLLSRELQKSCEEQSR